MATLESILSQEIVQRIGWTLVHFLWQGAAVAVVLAVVVRILRNYSANLRYVISCMALLLMVLLPVITFQLKEITTPSLSIVEPVRVSVQPRTEDIKATTTPVMPIIEPPQIGKPAIAVPRTPLNVRIISAIEPALPYLVLGWLIGVIGLSLWHLGGWTQLQRLRRRMVKPVDSSLCDKMNELADLLHIRRAVELAESALVQVPTVIGWLRPIILLPASAVTGLSGEQLEAILAHELAHIKRHDYLVNILQTAVEILGFYHPAVWWVSGRIRLERENCCDDAAVRICGDRVCYAKALATMEEIRGGQFGLAVAASGGSLFERIGRLLGKRTAEKERAGWLPSVIAVLLITAIVIPMGFALTNQSGEKLMDFENIVVEGINANRDKFECGVLEWSSKRIDTRYEGSRGNLSGQHELWWDGSKLATKYLRDNVYNDPEGHYNVKKEQGGNSYDGGILSREPDFRDDNWLGSYITRWRGPGSQDWLIRQDSKHENISTDWSVVDTDGVKLITLTTKNMNEKDPDYGGYGIKYYDPSKGYGLVNEEWYNAKGSLRMKHTVKLQEVIPGGWFPVKVDFKSFTITDGKVDLHQHYELDIERCSFNDTSALPKGIFELDMEKQLKYQKKLQKYLSMELAGLSNVKEAAKADKVKHGAREAIEKVIVAAMAGDFEKVREFAHPDRLPANQIADITEIAKGQNMWLMAAVADDSSAIAVSSVIHGDHDRTGPLVFKLDRVVLDGHDNWWVHDVDMETPDGAEGELVQFLKDHPEAKICLNNPDPNQQPEEANSVGAGQKSEVSDANLLAKMAAKLATIDTIIAHEHIITQQPTYSGSKIESEATLYVSSRYGVWAEGHTTKVDNRPSNDTFTGYNVNTVSPKDFFKTRGEYTSLGRSTINGREVAGIEMKSPFLVLGCDEGTCRIWIDVVTNLPVQVEGDGYSKDQKHRMSAIMYDFRWNQAIPASALEKQKRRMGKNLPVEPEYKMRTVIMPIAKKDMTSVAVLNLEDGKITNIKVASSLNEIEKVDQLYVELFKSNGDILLDDSGNVLTIRGGLLWRIDANSLEEAARPGAKSIADYIRTKDTVEETHAMFRLGGMRSKSLDPNQIVGVLTGDGYVAVTQFGAPDVSKNCEVKYILLGSVKRYNGSNDANSEAKNESSIITR